MKDPASGEAGEQGNTQKKPTGFPKETTQKTTLRPKQPFYSS